MNPPGIASRLSFVTLVVTLLLVPVGSVVAQWAVPDALQEAVDALDTGQAEFITSGDVLDFIPERQLLHELEIECPAMSIPEKLQVNINELRLGESLSVADIEIPEGIKVLEAAETVVVQCNEPQAQVEEEAAVGAAEPELIGRPEGEESDEV